MVLDGRRLAHDGSGSGQRKGPLGEDDTGFDIGGERVYGRPFDGEGERIGVLHLVCHRPGDGLADRFGKGIRCPGDVGFVVDEQSFGAAIDHTSDDDALRGELFGTCERWRIRGCRYVVVVVVGDVGV